MQIARTGIEHSEPDATSKSLARYPTAANAFSAATSRVGLSRERHPRGVSHFSRAVRMAFTHLP